MSVLLLGSVAGAPGVTTTAVALTMAWPRPVVLVEAAATGASAILPGYLAGRIAHTHGIIDAAVVARTGPLADALPDMLIPLPPSPHARLLAGLVRPEQAASMATAWPALGDALVDAARALEVDLIVDAGRLGLVGAPQPMIPVSDRVLLVTGSDLPALHAARAWLPALRAQLIDTSRLGLLVVGDARPYTAREIRRHLGAEVVGVIDHDPSGALPWSHGAPTPRRASPFARSITGLLPNLANAPAMAPIGGLR
ncbi:MAG: hypothetical protein WCF04_08760 [Candidatus Nanopelagicales bacterium]